MLLIHLHSPCQTRRCSRQRASLRWGVRNLASTYEIGKIMPILEQAVSNWTRNSADFGIGRMVRGLLIGLQVMIWIHY